MQDHYYKKVSLVEFSCGHQKQQFYIFTFKGIPQTHTWTVMDWHKNERFSQCTGAFSAVLVDIKFCALPVFCVEINL